MGRQQGRAAASDGKVVVPASAVVVRDQLRTLAAVDEGVGALLRALKRKGLLDNTVIVSRRGLPHGRP